ncbi:MAG: Fe-S protein assembly co-chaperone HscB [Gammaproteobacteria bacterium]
MAADLSSSYFQLFGLPRTFVIDAAQLDSRYRELQRIVHPDRYVNASDQERRLAMQQATRINEGYQTLKDPLKRGRYLLELGGFVFGDQHHTTRDPEFLMRQMELREALGAVKTAGDPLVVLARLIDGIADDFTALAGELQSRFTEGDCSDPQAAADTLMKMQFFRRLQQEAQELEAALEDELA